MKVLDLKCTHGHVFEGWFGSEDDFQQQCASGLLTCPVCGDAEVAKQLSAPRLNLSGAKGDEGGSGARAPTESGVSAAVADTPTSTLPSGEMAPAPQDLQRVFLQAVRHLMTHTEDVGTRFAAEARRMHEGEAPAKPIRGQATLEETRELLADGIDVLPLPALPGLKETLQ